MIKMKNFGDYKQVVIILIAKFSFYYASIEQRALDYPSASTAQ
jgi:hypothetical protein